MTTAPIASGDLLARHHTITGLRALADFLETNPTIPVEDYGADYTFFTKTSTDECGRALVDRVADLLGAKVHDNTARGGHYSASRRFGQITYLVIHVSAHAAAAFNATNSYATNIILDPDQEPDQGDQTRTGQAAPMNTPDPVTFDQGGTGHTLASPEDRPPLVPPVRRWACHHCGAGGLDSGGGRCPYCHGTGHHP